VVTAVAAAVDASGQSQLEQQGTGQTVVEADAVRFW
jgi:hypothetical protein